MALGRPQLSLCSFADIWELQTGNKQNRNKCANSFSKYIVSHVKVAGSPQFSPPDSMIWIMIEINMEKTLQ